jgi:coenzyme F420-0:L-glutamate ligase / coenzyme F420-1:gamma-L-glutamate ligase
VQRPSALTPEQRAFVAPRRTAILATQDPLGRPRLVPICFVVGAEDDEIGRVRLYSPLDEKTKRTSDPRRLARVRDLLVEPDATLLVDRWSEDWAHLGWVRLYARADLLEPDGPNAADHAAAVEGLRAKYEQYAMQRLEDRPVIRFAVDRAVSWGDLAAG